MFEKRLQNMTNKERALFRAYGLMRECMNDCKLDGQLALARAFEVAAELLEAGAEADWQYLNEFEYNWKES